MIDYYKCKQINGGLDSSTLETKAQSKLKMNILEPFFLKFLTFSFMISLPGNEQDFFTNVKPHLTQLIVAGE